VLSALLSDHLSREIRRIRLSNNHFVDHLNACCKSKLPSFCLSVVSTMSSFNTFRSASVLRQTIHSRSCKATPRNVLQLGCRHNSTSNEKPTPTSLPASEQAALADEPVHSSKWVAPKYDYSTDISALRKYTDLNIMKTQGRVYTSVTTLLSPDTAIVFPTIHGSDLNGSDKKIPQCSDAEAKVICFSAKEYGFAIVRDWCDPFVRRYNPASTDSVSNLTTAAVAEAAAEEAAAAESSAVESSAVAAENVPGDAVTSENVPDNTTTATESQTETQAVTQTKTAVKKEKAVTTEVALPEIRARVSCQEVVFIEHSLLWFFRSTYAKATMPRILPQQHSNTFLSFGSIRVSHTVCGIRCVVYDVC
jgi:hypothetical protein